MSVAAVKKSNRIKKKWYPKNKGKNKEKRRQIKSKKQIMGENFMKIFLKEQNKRKESMEEIVKKIFLMTKKEKLKKQQNSK